MSKTPGGMTEDPKRRGWRTKTARVIRDNPWWGALSAAFGVVGVVLALLGLGVFSGPSAPELLRMHVPGVSGPLAITPEAVRCGLTPHQLPAVFQEGAPRSVEGQVCLVTAKVQNEAQNQESAAVEAVLEVGSAKYPNIFAAPRSPKNSLGLLFDGQEVGVYYVFILPSGTTPTRLTFQARPESGKVGYDLRGTL